MDSLVTQISQIYTDFIDFIDFIDLQRFFCICFMKKRFNSIGLELNLFFYR